MKFNASPSWENSYYNPAENEKQFRVSLPESQQEMEATLSLKRQKGRFYDKKACCMRGSSKFPKNFGGRQRVYN
jgi:hypothetical protein